MNCPYCNKEFTSVYKLAYHKRICELNPESNINKQKIKENALKGLTYANKKNQLYHPDRYKMILVQRKCLKCGKIFYKWIKESQIKYMTKYCSRSCANSRILSKSTKEKISNALIKNVNRYGKKGNNGVGFQSKYKERICKVCGKHYYHIPHTGTTKLMCSKECSKYYKEHRLEFLSKDTIEKFSEAGRKSVEIQGETRRSKNEKLFFRLCLNTFNNIEHNKAIFNGWDADIILYDYKIAILWNGPWHYKEISKTSSLKQIQNRDKIKLEEIKKQGWIPYIIKDMGKYNVNFVNEQFDLFKQYLTCLKQTF